MADDPAKAAGSDPSPPVSPPQQPPSDTPPTVGPAPQAQAAAQPAQTPVPPETPAELSDEQIWTAFQDPRLQALLTLAQDRAPVAASAQPTPPATGEDTWDKIGKLVEEGDTEGLRSLVAGQKASEAQKAVIQSAKSEAAAETRRQIYASLAELPELKELSPSESLELVMALKQGDQAFFPAVAKVLAAKQSQPAQLPASQTPAGQAALANQLSAIAAGQVPGTPNLPAARSPSEVGPPPPDMRKSGYDYFTTILDWQEGQEQVGTP